MRDKWIRYRLKDVTEKIGSGSTPRGGKEVYLEKGDFSLIRSQNVLDFTFSKNGLAFISDQQAEELRNVSVEKDDILLNITGDSVARVCKVPSQLLPARVNQHVAIIRVKKSLLDSDFLKYSLLEPSFKRYMLGLASSGATRNALTKSMIENFEVNVPSLPQQIEIASILSALDAKIELNLQMNQTLEAMAKTLFKEWFVNFNFPGFDGKLVNGLPKGWRVGTLGDICSNVKKPYNPKLQKINSSYIGLEHIPRKSLSLSKWGHSSDINSQKSVFEKGNILFGKLRPYFHKVIIAPIDGITSTDVLVIKGNNTNSHLFSLMHLSSEECIQYANSCSDGTRMPRVNWSSLSKYHIVLPPEHILKIFQNIGTSFIERIYANIIENQVLVELRDGLLPQLMTGKIEVK